MNILFDFVRVNRRIDAIVLASNESLIEGSKFSVEFGISIVIVSHSTGLQLVHVGR